MIVDARENVSSGLSSPIESDVTCVNLASCSVVWGLWKRETERGV